MKIQGADLHWLPSDTSAGSGRILLLNDADIRDIRVTYNEGNRVALLAHGKCCS